MSNTIDPRAEYVQRDIEITDAVNSTRGSTAYEASIAYMTDLRIAEDEQLVKLLVREKHKVLTRQERQLLATTRENLSAVLRLVLEQKATLFRR